MWLSRAQIKADASMDALSPVLIPGDDNKRIGVAHRIVWTMFPGDPKAKRDFLWREEKPGQFIILSRRQPTASSFLDLESKRFAPDISVDSKLMFRLRANATMDKKQPGQKRSKRVDVVMDALNTIPQGKRAGPRKQELGWMETEEFQTLPPQAPLAWLQRQGANKGFEVNEAVVLGYDRVRLPRDSNNATKKKTSDIQFSALEFDGVLKITDQGKFIHALADGFGRAKAFGCGLMLIKRMAS
ncbi:MAG: type I-E CRISPR-associated protein Cas6/Cse3/CasE [Hyphomicrobiaceae bacterium]